MKRILGMGVGVVIFVIAFAAYTRASAGWDAGHSDIGFWWTIIALFLALVALSAMAGTLIHTQDSKG
jgi:hypothetical protein